MFGFSRNYAAVLLGAAAVVGVGNYAHANTIYFDLTGQVSLYHGNPNFPAYIATPGVTPNGGGFDYHYAGTLNTDSTLVSGSFFTVYDFAGYVTVLSTPANWSFTSQVTGVTPPLTTPPDGLLTNITFTYTGPTITLSPIQTPVDLGLFTIHSVIGNPSSVVTYASYDVQTSTGVSSGNVNTTIGPDVTRGNPTPLPAAAWGGLSMMGGLGGLGILRRRKR
jgi:hypothetical protein